MIYFSDAELDAFLLEDIDGGDVTTKALGFGIIPAKMTFYRKKAGRLAGVALAAQILTKLGLSPAVFVEDGEDAAAGTLLIEVTGRADVLHQGWRVAQVLMEWSCGVAQYVADMVSQAKQVNPNAVIACTRKCVPGSRKLSMAAVVAGGGRIHRQGLAETVLVFDNHRRLLSSENSLDELLVLKTKLPENSITIEADNLAQVEQMLALEPDIIQLDKFSLADVEAAKALIASSGKAVQLSLAGGVNRDNMAQFAQTGLALFITSAPYYAKPEDIKVVIEKV